MTIFVTRRFMVTFVVGLTKFVIKKILSVVRGRRDQLYDHKGQHDLLCQFDLVNYSINHSMSG